MAKTMNKRSGHKRSGHKRSMHKRTAKKERKGTKAYRKGSKSKTMKGKKDFTTKKTSKVFNRRKHYQKHAKGSRVIRRPYHKKGGTTHHNRSTSLSPTELHDQSKHKVPRRIDDARVDSARVDAAQSWGAVPTLFQIPNPFTGIKKALAPLAPTGKAIIKILKGPVTFSSGKDGKCKKDSLGKCLVKRIIPEDYGPKSKKQEIDGGQLGNTPSLDQ